MSKIIQVGVNQEVRLLGNQVQIVEHQAATGVQIRGTQTTREGDEVNQSILTALAMWSL